MPEIRLCGIFNKDFKGRGNIFFPKYSLKGWPGVEDFIFNFFEEDDILIARQLKLAALKSDYLRLPAYAMPITHAIRHSILKRGPNTLPSPLLRKKGLKILSKEREAEKIYLKNKKDVDYLFL